MGMAHSQESMPENGSCFTLCFPSPCSDHAKLLWKRIPETVKQSNGEIAELWVIGKRLWRRDFAAVYEPAQNPAWPPHIAPLMTSLIGEWRVNVSPRLYFPSFIPRPHSPIPLPAPCITGGIVLLRSHTTLSTLKILEGEGRALCEPPMCYVNLQRFFYYQLILLLSLPLSPPLSPLSLPSPSSLLLSPLSPLSPLPPLCYRESETASPNTSE